MKTNGILMAISSLPGDFGIGDLGENAYKFVDYLKKAGIKIWQILPLNPTGYGNSPYQSICGHAIDSIYIDLYELEKDGLIDNPKPFNKSKKLVDYPAVRAHKEKYLRQAFKNDKDTLSKPVFKKFVKENPWVEDYAEFTILSLKNNYQDWWYWDKKERYAHYRHEFDFSPYEEEILFLEWCQFIAFKQFKKLKEYINKNGVLLMGDIPFYVGENSSDCWANQDEFKLDENDIPEVVAGVPPDYFSETGQRWGNPIYDWEYMKEDNFTFWMERIEFASSLFDIIRIDHFRAFDTYWAVDRDCKTAIVGEWKHAYGDELFHLLFEKHPDINIIAEDLGDLFPSVLELRDKYNLKGMNVLEFTVFNPTFEVKENQIIYSGTHDNDTLKGWYKKLKDNEIELLKIIMRREGIKGRGIKEKLFNMIFGSICDVAIIPIQDYLWKDNDARMNAPGLLGGHNWEYKLADFTEFVEVIPFIKSLNKKFNR